ncbi:GyrI-like domain-containing protein [Pseudonocardia sp. CA-107938]|uniref:GyrI-like domain-containing protein n=1 Tax=Pseudonocardia sp. CA-107938 TaxID=3240021 RepID=UPI003D8EF34E
MTTSTTAPELLDIPARDLLTVDGTGGPETDGFGRAIRALFAVRAALGGTGDVPLEGTYTQGDDLHGFDLDAPDGWHWRLAVPAPSASAAAVATAAERFGAPVHLRRSRAQRVARVLHVGPYSAERPALAALYGFVAAQGLVPTDGHTEVYLSDPATVPAEQLRTYLQVPVMMVR